jgi:hypothetical protein
MGPIDVEIQKLAQENHLSADDIQNLLDAGPIDEEIQQLIHEHNLTAAEIQKFINIDPLHAEIQKLLEEHDLTVEGIRKLFDAGPVDEAIQQLIHEHSLNANSLRKLLAVDEEILRLIHEHSLTAISLGKLLSSGPIDEEIQQLIHEHNLTAAGIQRLIDAERAGVQKRVEEEKAQPDTGNGAASVPASPTEITPKTDKGEGKEPADEPMDAATYFANVQTNIKELFTSYPDQNVESPAPGPLDPYTEVIYTNLATRQRLRHLVAQEHLTIEDANFLNDFVQEQSSEPNREILRNLWLVSQPAARALRNAAAKLSRPRDPLIGLHLVNSPLGILAWPWRMLWEHISSLDQADYRAAAAQSEERVTNQLRHEFHVEREIEKKQEKVLGPATAAMIPRRAPVGITAALLRGGPKPGVAWSILTVLLYIALFALLLHNVITYYGLKMDQRQWERTNEPPYKAWSGVVGGGTSCWKVCANDGWGWRWRAYLREFVLEAGRGAWPS